MAYRSIMVVNPAHIHCRNEQLLIETDEPHSVPLEDITALLVESRQSTLTAAALAALGQNNVAVYFCDEKHLPCAALLPFAQHSRQPEILQAQLLASEPCKKRLWQQIVQQKIHNQAECLALCSKESAAAQLHSMARSVISGDKNNTEAVAAAAYFPALFGGGFVRGDSEDARNAALNYGYAIVRGAVARSLAAYGLLPALGLHHASGLNAFNLADDCMEPFRPLVDLYVAANVRADATLDTALKGYLFNLLNMDMRVGGKSCTAAYAAELLVQSLQACLLSRSDALKLPQLMELHQHTYE